MSKKVLEGVILAYANLTLAICYPILALLRLIGIAFYDPKCQFKLEKK